MTANLTPQGLMPQKNGTYAITIECPNGLVAPHVLDAITGIARDLGAIVHLTTAQKIMMLDLGEAEGKQALTLLDAAGVPVRKARDISQPRVCVGRPYCTLALQETFPLGEHLYRECARIPIPPKIKVAVSGCPAGCSWPNCVDLGFVGVKSGFIVMLGGHGGARPAVGEEIGRISTYEEAGKILRNLAELFSGEVKMKSRVDRLVKKLGMDEVKKRIWP